MLFNKDNITFHLQSKGTNIDRVVTELMHTPFAVSTERINCTNCGILTKPGDLGYHIMILSNRGDNTATALQSYQKQKRVRCPSCMQAAYSNTCYNDAPKVIMTELAVLGSRQYLPSKNIRYFMVIRLTAVQFGPGSGVFCLNLEPTCGSVRMADFLNLNLPLNLRFTEVQEVQQPGGVMYQIFFFLCLKSSIFQ